MTIDHNSSWFNRYPIASFFILALGISWAGWIPFGASKAGVISWTVPDEVPMFTQFGPAIAALVFIGFRNGQQGLRLLLAKLIQWRARIHWYGAGLFITPLAAMVVIGIHALIGWSTPELVNLAELHRRYVESIRTGGWNVLEPVPRPTIGFITFLAIIAETGLPGALATFIFTGLMFGALSEEPGWRGYMLPRLQGRFGSLKGSLILAVYWGLWHTGPDFWMLTFRGDPRALAFPIVITIGSVPLAILFTWIYNGSGGSLLLSVLFHASLNMTYSLMGLTWPEVPFQFRYVEFTVVFFLFALIVVWATKGQLAFKTGEDDESSNPNLI